MNGLPLLLLLLGAGFPLSASWSRHNQIYKYCGDSTASCTLTVPAVGSGHLLAVAVAYNGSNISLSSATGAANVWVHPTHCKAFLTGYQAVDWIYALSATSGTSINVALNGNASYVDAFYFEYSGTAPVSFESCSNPTHGTSTKPLAGDLTTYGANNLAIAIVKGDQRIIPGSMVTPAPWASTPIFVSGGEAVTEALNFTSVNSPAATFTASSMSNFVGVSIAFKDASPNTSKIHAQSGSNSPPAQEQRKETAASSWMGQIAADMGINEAHPKGAQGYGFYNSSVISDGNNPYASQPSGASAVDYWGTVYVDESGNNATNTRVAIRNCAIYWKRASNGIWKRWGPDLHPGDIGDYPENFQGPSTTSNMRIEADGTMSVKPATGKTSHWYGPYPRVAIDKDDLGGIVSVCEVRLVVDDPSKPDDRLAAKYLVNVGADYYPSTIGKGIANNPGVGSSKFKRVSILWRSVAMTTLSRLELEANPPPVDLTGDGIKYERRPKLYSEHRIN